MIHDISPLVDPSISVWPGDTPFAAVDLLRLERGDSVHLSSITLSCHTGAHADAPCHFLPGAPGIEAVPLERYLGPCHLADVRPEDRRIRPRDLEPLGLEFLDTPRLLLRTRERTDRSVFPDPFTCLTPELVQWLADRGVLLVGLDSPSVDPFESKDLPCHKALYRRGIANLESLELDGVPIGRYELIALPLRLSGRDASPVRAILRTLPGRRQGSAAAASGGR